MTGIPAPRAGRLTVVALSVVSAALAYPWQPSYDRWAVGVAGAATLASLSWWRGEYLSTIARRRIRMLLHRGPVRTVPEAVHSTGADAVATALVRVEAVGRPLPMVLLARYLDRYGVVCDSVRVTSRTTPDTTTTWIGLAVSGARNMSALRGRSAEIPLRQTAEAAARRLAAQLVEIGWTATYVEEDELPVLAAPHAREGWRSVVDDHGHLTTYAVVDPESAAAGVSPAVGQESWTAVEIVGTPTRPQIRAGTAIRTHDRPATTAPMPGLLPMPGRQASALAALHPLSGVRLVN